MWRRYSYGASFGSVEAATDLEIAAPGGLLAKVPNVSVSSRVTSDVPNASFSPFFALDSAQVVERAFAVPDWPRAVLDAYLAEDVTKQAAYKPGTGFRGPRYPDGLRAARRGGVVRAQFVVDGKGRADMTTFQALESDDELFTRSVRDAAKRLEFVPAELDGAPVPQVFEMDVEFRLADAPFRLHAKNAITVTATPPQ